MKASIAVALTGAVLAAASPVAKRVLTTSVVTELVFTTVYEGEETAAPKAAVFFAGVHSVSSESTETPPPPEPTTSTSTPPPPPPPPTTTSEAPPPPPQTQAASPPPPPAPAVQVSGDYVSVMLNQHNIHRFNHSSPALSWDSDLAAKAGVLAETCVFGHKMDIGGGGYGQNLGMAGGTNAASASGTNEGAKAVTNQWYNGEVNDYPGYGGEPNMGTFGQWGHFSALVWAGTTRVGCVTKLCRAGSAMGSMDSWYTVCNYGPPGNVGGAYAANVKRPQGQANVIV